MKSCVCVCVCALEEDSHMAFGLSVCVCDVLAWSTCMDTVISCSAASASACLVLSRMLCPAARPFSSSTNAFASFSLATPACKPITEQEREEQAQRVHQHYGKVSEVSMSI